MSDQLLPLMSDKKSPTFERSYFISLIFQLSYFQMKDLITVM